MSLYINVYRNELHNFLQSLAGPEPQNIYKYKVTYTQQFVHAL